MRYTVQKFLELYTLKFSRTVYLGSLCHSKKNTVTKLTKNCKNLTSQPKAYTDVKSFSQEFAFEANHEEVDQNPSESIKLKGVLPIQFRQHIYNVPISLNLNKYPSCPPIVFVEPGLTMEIVPMHKYVADNGRVSCEYLDFWSESSSNLIELANVLIQYFSSHPPMYSIERNVSVLNTNETTRSQLEIDLETRLTHEFTKRRQESMVELEELLSENRTLKTRSSQVEELLMSGNEIRQLFQKNIEILLQVVQELEYHVMNATVSSFNVIPKNSRDKQVLDALITDQTIEDLMLILVANYSGDVELKKFIEILNHFSKNQFLSKHLLKKLTAPQLIVE
ncbi:hypothetical protein GEMRC1_011378 [Eukaryota sp. GEM-RC1]